MAGQGHGPLPHVRARHPCRYPCALRCDLFGPCRAGRRLPQPDPRTVADGLRTALSDRTFAHIRRGCATETRIGWSTSALSAATGAGLSIFIGGTVRDLVNHAAGNGTLGEALATPATGYSVVYHTEIGLLFLTLIVLGPLVRLRPINARGSAKLGLADFPT